MYEHALPPVPINGSLTKYDYGGSGLGQNSETNNCENENTKFRDHDSHKSEQVTY